MKNGLQSAAKIIQQFGILKKNLGESVVKFKKVYLFLQKIKQSGSWNFTKLTIWNVCPASRRTP